MVNKNTGLIPDDVHSWTVKTRGYCNKDDDFVGLIDSLVNNQKGLIVRRDFTDPVKPVFVPYTGTTGHETSILLYGNSNSVDVDSGATEHLVEATVTAPRVGHIYRLPLIIGDNATAGDSLFVDLTSGLITTAITTGILKLRAMESVDNTTGTEVAPIKALVTSIS